MGRNKNIKEKILDFLAAKKVYFDSDFYSNLQMKSDYSDFDYINDRTLKESEISEAIGGNKRSSVNEALKVLENEGKILVFRYYNKIGHFLFHSDGQDKKGFSKHIALPGKISTFVGEDHLTQIGGKIVGSKNILEHLKFSDNKFDHDGTYNFQFHFAYALKMLNLTILNSVWNELAGRPLIVFITNNFIPETQRGRENNLELDYTKLDPLGEGLLVFQLPMQGIRPPLRSYEGFQPNTSPPLLGTIALTLFQNNKSVILSRFTNDSLAICNLQRSKDQSNSKSLENILNIDKWLMQGTRWPEYITESDTGYKSPLATDLASDANANCKRIDEFLLQKVMPNHIDCRSWYKLHMNVHDSLYSAKSTAPRCDEDHSFKQGILANSWLIECNSLISVKQSYLVLSS